METSLVWPRTLLSKIYTGVGSAIEKEGGEEKTDNSGG